MSTLTIPELSLVLLIGASGSGKSTLAHQHFGPYEVISSDYCRGLVSDDQNDQAATKDAFEVLEFIAGKRLAAGKLTVIDATNVQREARRSLIALARAHDVLPVAIVLDAPESVCVERNAERADRDFGARVVRRQRDQLRRSQRGLTKEGLRTVHTLTGVDEISDAQIVRERLRSDLRDERGPFDVIGDIHGCRSELETLLAELGYAVVRDAEGLPVDAVHPAGRRAIFVGDLVDRGPDSSGVLRLVMGMVSAGHALCVPGNHEHKLVRALGGAAVQITHGLETTLAELGMQTPEFRDEVRDFCDSLVAHLVLDDGALVVAHAGLKEAYHGRASGRVRSFALYGDSTGETDEFGLPVRYPWANDYRGKATVLYGHTPVPEIEWVNNTLCLDTGCVFGGRLSAMRYPEREVVSVPAEQVWYEPVKPLGHVSEAKPVESGLPTTSEAQQGADRSHGNQLNLDDVVGKRVIDTGHHGRVSVHEDNAAGALEVMSRFALPPHLVPYLPPTMAPAPTSTRDGLLEHPEEAFSAYRKHGVRDLICEEKHMGSRAVVLLCADADVAAGVWGCAEGQTGAVYTRTGRSFFSADDTETFLGRLRAAVSDAGVWSELDTNWILFDAEIVPWSLKAEQLLREQYASVGAAAGAVLPVALNGLGAAASRGIDVTDLLSATSARATNAASFRSAYRQYCWSTDGMVGVQVAPFHVLATSGATHHHRNHGWHLEVADRLVAADPDLARPTRRVVVATDDPDSITAATQWWADLTAAGGEGMVVKPMANLVRQGGKGLVQPGIKVRGREYLRIIYGPDYTQPANLERLRQRHLGLKRSLALREYALGLESLERLTAGEPLWRVHEAVFAVLALESERVDPRL